ncbi:hypothetical protein Acife_0513 [Acidithiobacillus ferrivorans SS3]|uniref:Uncharacterized protein n=1 Tax=Acidithiobacillus ferrivorans SS3 TaxID=743299 RepID=G0JTW8_9PROT|nr:hypothetical protein [Acidithiobacillus ferrivorans]AEM46720.1 hypothetical protein Acife_0513 [Acidithiobacillus ferrivorans SS3]OFA16132.1 hypothetical protein A4U49_09130 [Acidithiobacillus ferrivorans]
MNENDPRDTPSREAMPGESGPEDLIEEAILPTGGILHLGWALDLLLGLEAAAGPSPEPATDPAPEPGLGPAPAPAPTAESPVYGAVHGQRPRGQ